VEIFLVTIGTAKRAPTFQINVAVTNFAPERIVSDKRGSAADKCIRKKHILGIADSFGIEGEKPSPQMTIIKKKKKNGEGEGCHHDWVVAMPVLMCNSCAGSRQEGK